MHLYVMPRTLENFDFVAIGVLNEEEPGEHLFAAFEFLHGRGMDAELRHALMLIFKLWNGYSDVPIAVAMCVCRLAAFVPRQLNLEVVLFVAKIDQREVGEIKAVTLRQPT